MLSEWKNIWASGIVDEPCRVFVSKPCGGNGLKAAFKTEAAAAALLTFKQHLVYKHEKQHIQLFPTGLIWVILKKKEIWTHLPPKMGICGTTHIKWISI